MSMFTRRTFRQTGYGQRTVRFADIDGAVCTTTYSTSMSHEERAEMAKRITAALNFTMDLETGMLQHFCLTRVTKYVIQELCNSVDDDLHCTDIETFFSSLGGGQRAYITTKAIDAEHIKSQLQNVLCDHGIHIQLKVESI